MSNLNEEEQKLLDSFKLHEIETRRDNQPDDREDEREEEHNLHQSEYQGDQGYDHDKPDHLQEEQIMTRDDKIVSNGRLDPLEGTFGRPVQKVEEKGKEDDADDKEDEEEGLNNNNTDQIKATAFDEQKNPFLWQSKEEPEEGGLSRLKRIQQKLKTRQEISQTSQVKDRARILEPIESTNADKSKSPNVSSQNRTATSMGLLRRHPGPNHTSSRVLDTKDEQQKILERMKEKFEPINFEDIKRHERQFMADVYMRKQLKEKEAKEKFKEVENIYKGSKMYSKAREDYIQSRQPIIPAKLHEGQETRERIKKYTEKIRLMNQVEDRVSGSVNGLLAPMGQTASSGNVSKKGESVYGRFGKEWEKKLNQQELEKKYLDEVKEKGNEYMKYGKSKASKKDERVIEEKFKEEEEEAKKQAKSIEIGMDYLKYAKSKAQKKDSNLDSNDLARISQAGSAFKQEDKLLVMSKLGKMESDISMMEAKVRNKVIDKDSKEIENAYLKNIKAKLSLLEEI